MTGGEILSKALTPNFALRDACAAYKAKQLEILIVLGGIKVRCRR